MEAVFVGPLFLLFMFLLFALFVGSIALWIWTLVDVVKVPHDNCFRAGNQLTWILVVVLAGVLGSIIYLAVGRPPPGLRR